MVIRLLLIAILANVFVSATEAKMIKYPKPRITESQYYTEYLLTDRKHNVYHTTTVTPQGMKVRKAVVFRSRQDCRRYQQAYMTPTERHSWHCSGVDPD
jgi:hypothetical protein